MSDYFCYITITNSTAFISKCVTSSLSILLAIYIIYKFCQMRGSHNKQTAFVYGNMIVWWLSTFVNMQLSLDPLCTPSGFITRAKKQKDPILMMR